MPDDFPTFAEIMRMSKEEKAARLQASENADEEPVGLNESMRRVELERAAQTDRTSVRAKATADRQSIANKLIHDLASETLAVLRERNYPRALEIKSVVRQSKRFGRDSFVVNAGQTLWLVQKAHVFGQPMVGVGLLDSGEFVKFESGEHGVDERGHFTNYNQQERVESIREAMQRAGCTAATKSITVLNPVTNPPSEWGGDCFWLRDTGELVFGSEQLYKSAEKWVAEQLI